jgi:phosphohistidine swiveling domain-containing protein
MSASSIALILPLADAQNGRRTGAKATCLSKLVAASFAVPRGFVLSADAYRAHLWASGAREIASATADAEQREAIRAAILSHDVPKDVWQAVAEAYERLSWQTGLCDPKVAVRSSALDEGVNGGGFPGAYESYLNVSGLDELNAAVKRVWASLWSGKAAAYRARFSAAGEPAMAVIVQQMVAADLTGTAFTANPVTGDPHGVMVMARSSDAEPAHYTVDLRELCVSRTAGTPESAAQEDLVRRVVEQSILVEDAVGGRISVEWAADREGIWILQADPIHDLPAHFPMNGDHEPEGGALWARQDPQPISYFARSIAPDNSPTKGAAPKRKVRNGYLYVRRERPMECTDRARSKAIDEAAASLREWQKRISSDLSVRVSELLGADLRGLDNAALSDTIQSAADAARLSYDWMCRSESRSARLPELLGQLVGDRQLAWRLLGGVQDVVFDRDALLQELSERFAIAETSGKLEDETWWRGYKADVERFARDYGYAFKSPGEAADPARWRSWIEDTDPVFRMIGAISRRGNGPTLVTLHCAAEQDAHAAEAEAITGLLKGRQADLKKLLELGREWIRARSQIEHTCTLAAVALRLSVIELARRLEIAGAISSSEDIFMLSVDELVALPSEPDAAERTQLSAKIARRKHELWLERRLSAPETLPIEGEAAKESSDANLTGTPASTGSVSGRARVVESVEDAAEIERGDLLVCASQGTAWTPFIALAGGFVCASGHDMCAVAIASRLYGIPAVVGCAGTDAIRDGQKIAIDGSAGIVYMEPRIQEFCRKPVRLPGQKP